MNGLSERLRLLGSEIAAEQDRFLAQDLLLGRVRARILVRPLPRSSRSKMLPALVAVAALVACAVWYGWGTLRRPLDATLGNRPLAVGEWVSAAEANGPPIHFSDGSEIALAAGSRARLATLDSVGAHLVLESGGADVRVTPHHGARYRVSVGPFAVDVTGTRFDVGFRASDELFTLNLHEGTVIVSGCMLGEGRKILAGESLSASCRTGKLEISAARADAGSEPVGGAPPPSASVEPQAPLPEAEIGGPVLESGKPGLRELASSTSWQSLSRQGRFSEAYVLVEREGFRTVMLRASLPELSLLGDTARFAGKPGDALDAYQALRLRGAGSAAARQAAFSIARVHFDQRASYAEAAQWFRTYLAEQPGGPLAREAQGRLMESLSRAGDRAGARSNAEAYLSKYPGGPHERVARQLLAH